VKLTPTLIDFIHQRLSNQDFNHCPELPEAIKGKDQWLTGALLVEYNFLEEEIFPVKR
jgi:hypothetical protein